jgi:hypothetical protein
MGSGPAYRVQVRTEGSGVLTREATGLPVAVQAARVLVTDGETARSHVIVRAAEPPWALPSEAWVRARFPADIVSCVRSDGPGTTTLSCSASDEPSLREAAAAAATIQRSWAWDESARIVVRFSSGYEVSLDPVFDGDAWTVTPIPTAGTFGGAGTTDSIAPCAGAEGGRDVIAADERTDLAAAIEHVFGAPAGHLAFAQDIQHRALSFNPASWNLDESSCAGYPDYLGHEDVIVRAIQQDHCLFVVADLVHWFLDVVLAAVPFRHEAFLVEVAQPHRLWYAADGEWMLRTNALFDDTGVPGVPAADDPFFTHLARVRWVFHLFPRTHDLVTIPTVISHWRRDEAAHDAASVLAQWRRSARTCGDTLGGLWGAYFLGATAVELEEIVDAADEHPGAAVRSSATLVRELEDRRSGRLHDEIRKRRAAFLTARRLH